MTAEHTTRDWLEVVKVNEITLMKVPKALRTEAVCLAAVWNNGFALQYVPKARRTNAVCLAAVRENGGALQYVPKKTPKPHDLF